jgi:hypothetical protein
MKYLCFAYDMSIPNVAHLDPQRGGCCTIMPFIAHIDPPYFARAMFADGCQGYDCTHISGAALGEALPSVL